VSELEDPKLGKVELEPRCAAFFEHWKALRHGKLVPTVEDFLDRPSILHAPLVFMVEVSGDSLIPRLHGTGIVARWDRDLTARKMHDDRDKGYLKELLDNYRAVMAHPCGCYLLNEYSTASGGISRVRVIYLPLASKPGRPPRVVGYSCELDARFSDEPFSDRQGTMEAMWIDIGAGVPSFAPHLPGKTP
jgi:hypothetical protein